MINAYIFDMDGLLIESEPLWRKAQLAAFGTVGIKPNVNDMEQTMGRRIDEVVEHWYHLQPWEGSSQKDIEALIVDGVIELIKTEGRLKEGVHHVLDLCRSTAKPIALASSSPMELINTVLKTFDIGEYFDIVISAEHESHGKPHPAVFVTTADRLNVKPQEILVFEDSPSGVLAAKAAKMKCIAVQSGEIQKHKFVQTADLILDSLEDFDLRQVENL